MSEEELTEWEHRQDIIRVLTSYEMGDWLHRRDKRLLQEIRHEIDSHGIIMKISNGEKIIGENVYIAKEVVLEIIDKHISGKESE